MSLYMWVPSLIYLYNSLSFYFPINLLWTSRICDKVCTGYFWTMFITGFFYCFLSIKYWSKISQGQWSVRRVSCTQRTNWEQTRAGNGSPCHHMDILLREMDGYNGKARRRKHRCPQRTTDGVFMPLALETRGSITSASAGPSAVEVRAAGRGWE